MAGSKKAGALVDGDKKKSKGKKEGPKRAVSAYIHFCNERRAQLARENPEMKGKAAMTELGRLWRELTEEEKQPYQRKYEEEKERYDQEVEEVKANEEKGKRGATKSPKRSRSKSPPKTKGEVKKANMMAADDAECEDDKNMKKTRKRRGGCGTR